MRTARLLRVLAWAAVTGGAVALSWLGVSSALTDAANDPPQAFAVPGRGEATARPRPGTPSAAATRTPRGSPTPSVTRTPSPTRTRSSPPPTRSTHSPSATPSATRSHTHAPGGAGHGGPSQHGVPGVSDGGTTAAGHVRSISVRGGRAAVALRPSDAELVSATPEAGWSMQVWRSPTWLRVHFSRENESSDIHVTWDGHPPVVRVQQRQQQ